MFVMLYFIQTHVVYIHIPILHHWQNPKRCEGTKVFCWLDIWRLLLIEPSKIESKKQEAVRFMLEVTVNSFRTKELETESSQLF